MKTTRGDNKFVLVLRKTRLEELIERFNTWEQARFYLEHQQIDIEDYHSEHKLYKQKLQDAEALLRELGRLQVLERGFLANYQFAAQDIIVVIGQDGLVANTLKYLDGQPVIAVNPDPARWDGKLLPFTSKELASVVATTLSGNCKSENITFAQATTNDGQSILAVNDLFIGPKTHSSARYTLQWNDQRETQSSSGIIVSTGFGSTGWLQSVLAGAKQVCGQASHELDRGYAWHERWLNFAVREPFPSKTTGTQLAFGKITENNPMVVESAMPENGVIFSDGIEHDYLNFNSGCKVTIEVARKVGKLVTG
jgi:NAD kinase